MGDVNDPQPPNEIFFAPDECPPVAKLFDIICPALGHDPADVRPGIVIDQKIAQVEAVGRALTIPDIVTLLPLMTTSKVMQVVNELVSRELDEDINGHSDGDAVYDYTAETKTIKVDFEQGAVIDADLSEKLSFAHLGRRFNIAAALAGRFVAKSKALDVYATNSVIRMIDGDHTVELHIRTIVVDNLRDLTADHATTLGKVTINGLSDTGTKYVPLKITKPVSKSLGSCVLVDSSGDARAKLKQTGQVFLDAVSQEPNEGNFLKVIAEQHVNVIRSLDAAYKIFTIRPSTDANYKYQIHHLPARVALVHLVDTQASLYSAPNLAVITSFVWLRDIARCSSNSTPVVPDAQMVPFMELAAMGNVGAKTKQELGLMVTFKSCKELYKVSTEIDKTIVGDHTIRDITAGVKYLIRSISSFHRANTSTIIATPSFLSGRTQLLRFVRQLSSISLHTALQENKEKASSLIDGHIPAEEKSKGILTHASRDLIQISLSLHISSCPVLGILKILRRYRGEGLVGAQERQAYRQLTMASRPYTTGTVSTSASLVAGWCLNIMGTPLRDELSPAHVKWTDDRGNNDFILDLILKNLNRSANITKAMKSVLLMALTDKSLDVPQLATTGDERLDYNRSRVLDVLEHMKNLQFSSIVARASSGKVTLTKEEGMGNIGHLKTGTSTAEKTMMVVITELTVEKVENAINEVIDVITGGRADEAELILAVEVMNASIKIAVHSGEIQDNIRVYNLVRGAMPSKSTKFTAIDFAGENKLRRLRSFLIQLKEVVVRLLNISKEEAAIALSIMSNLLRFCPDQGVMDQHEGADCEYLVRIMFTIESLKVTRLAIVNLQALGGERHKEALERSRGIQERLVQAGQGGQQGDAAVAAFLQNPEQQMDAFYQHMIRGFGRRLFGFEEPEPQPVVNGAAPNNRAGPMNNNMAA